MTRPQKMYRATLIMSEPTESTESLAGLKWYPVGRQVLLGDSNKTRVWLKFTSLCPVEGGPKGSSDVDVAIQDYVDRGVSNPEGCSNSPPKEIVLLNPATGKKAKAGEFLHNSKVLVYKLESKDRHRYVYFVNVDDGSKINFDNGSSDDPSSDDPSSDDPCIKNFDRVEDDEHRLSYVLFDENPLRPDSKPGCASIPGLPVFSIQWPQIVIRKTTDDLTL